MADEAILLIPGLGETGDIFAAQTPMLRARMSCSVARTGRYFDLRMEASAILMEAPPAFALAGHSMGGYLAFEIMRQAPQRVTRLLLVSTRAGGDTQEQRDRREELIRMAEDEGLDAVHDALWPGLSSAASRNSEGIQNRVRGMLETTGVPRFVVQQRAILNRISYFGVLPRIRIPTAIIVGAADAIAPPEAARAIRDGVAGSELTLLRNCGHLALLEKPLECGAAMERWLSRPAPSRR